MAVLSAQQDAAATTRERELEDALRDEVLMLEQSVKTLREMREGWRDLTDEFEGGYLIEQYLDSLIEDLNPANAKKVLDAHS